MRQRTVIEVSPKSVFIVVGVLVLFYVAWQVKGIIIALFLSYILMSGFAPLVDALTSRGVSKPVSIVLTYICAISFFAILLFAIIPPLVEQTRGFFSNLPGYVEGLTNTFNNNSDLTKLTTENITNLISSKLGDALANLVSVLFNAFSLFISFITVAVFTFYLLLERERIKRNVFPLLPNLSKEKAYALAHDIEQKLGAWVRGELLLMLIVGLATYIGLTLLQIEFALPLAVIAGLLELIPTFGPIISSIPAIIIAFVQSPILAIAVAALYLLVQQLENNILVPKVMEKAVGIHPLIIILALLIGSTIFGVIGAILAVPTAGVIQVVIEHQLVKTRKR